MRSYFTCNLFAKINKIKFLLFNLNLKGIEN